ncbi:energy transducer TonB [Aeromonas australiensis]|uniref:energy transducer TonB n=1 Tax=Aeromonas australiensis TaxID=1114880 RepID=UPI000589DC0E|nr:energy transducer TonB [Aeromonas australiensis]MCF3096702.1 energy transducer TonB [Aeromonas australiensis]
MRYLISFAAAFLVVFGLFWGMNKLVNQERRELQEKDEVSMVDFIRLKPQETLQEKQRELPKPPPPKRPPPPPEMEVATTDRPRMESAPMDMPKLDIPVNIAGGNALGAYSTGSGGGGAGGNNGAIPLATFEPMMPRKAALAGLASGKVLLEFTVTERGTVSDVRIVKEEPRSYDLGKEARKTIAKWTFKPAMIDGKAQASRMQQEIEFAVN